MWRSGPGRKMPVESGLFNQIGRAVHATLYLLVGATVCTGVARALVHESPISGRTISQNYVLVLHAPLKPAARLHGTAAASLIILAGMHAVAALAHHMILRDTILIRMPPVIRTRLRPSTQFAPALAVRDWMQRRRRLLFKKSICHIVAFAV